MRHGNEYYAGAYPTAPCTEKCTMCQACHTHAEYIAWHVRREQIRYFHASTMEYSLRSDCLVAMFEGEDLYEATARYTSVLTVLDLAAGGRMLCRLEDIMCALPPPAPCAAQGCVTATTSLHCAGVTHWRRSRC